jgi:hypothetical protein
VRGKPFTVSPDRVKPAYVLNVASTATALSRSTTNIQCGVRDPATATITTTIATTTTATTIIIIIISIIIIIIIIIITITE